MNQSFSLSANIEDGFPSAMQYVVTPNGLKSVSAIIDGYKSGIHSFTIIGTYGTGKSSFLLALESDLKKTNRQPRLLNPSNLSSAKGYMILNVVGDYQELSTLLGQKLHVEGTSQSVLDELKAYYRKVESENKFLVIVVDEFGKVLEHAAKNNPERELYFMQKLAEFVNHPSRNILLLTTLHQNFGAYARDLTETQKNEWQKVKGRFMEIAFVEPVEQLLFLASKQLLHDHNNSETANAQRLYRLSQETGLFANPFSEETALQLYPLDAFSAYTITSAIHRYGQNERSLFSFLSTRGSNSIQDFEPSERCSYNLANVYDYIVYNFYSYLKDANTDSMSWSSMQVAVERAEGLPWDNAIDMSNAVKILKAIGLLNLFGKASFRLSESQMCDYATNAMDVENATYIIQRLRNAKIIRYAEYKSRLLLFDGTDVDLEAEVLKAGSIVSRPADFIDDLRSFINKRIAPVKAHYYQKGTPRFFEYEIREEPILLSPTGDTDGFIELIFNQSPDFLERVKDFSRENDGEAIIYVYFKNTENLVDHLYNIQKYKYILEKVLIDKNGDRVAYNEIEKLVEYEETLLNKAISDCLFAYKGQVDWIFRGKTCKVSNFMDFNKLLSFVCDTIYSKTPVLINELFNRQKLSSTISLAKKNYLTALVEHHSESDLGFEENKFPPEKTIYCSLLKNTGLHKEGCLRESPENEGIMPLWNACETFLKSTINKHRRISELIKLLSQKPYKLKQGFIDFWLPTYLFIKRQDYALHDVSTGSYIPVVDMAFFELLQRQPSNYTVKAFALDGVNIDFFNQYRKYVNLGEELSITTDNFIETIRPFLFFYKRLNEYAKHTRKFDHQTTERFRNVLATAKDPEKAFFEDLPESLGFDKRNLSDSKSLENYGALIHRSIRELRSCYSQLIDRIEERVVDEFGLQNGDYEKYVQEVQERLSSVKTYLLTDKLKEFYHHVMTEYDNRTLWFQSICYVVLDHKLESLKDEEEEKLSNDLVYMFRECEKYADISKKTDDLTGCEAYSFDMVSSKGETFYTQTYILPKSDKDKSTKLEERINQLLTGDNNLDVCTLLSILNKKIKQ